MTLKNWNKKDNLVETCILKMWVPLCWMKARKLSRRKVSVHWPQVIVSGDPDEIIFLSKLMIFDG